MNHTYGTHPGEAWADVDREKKPCERCDCGHRRLTHNGATSRNDGGNECRMCDCPLYQKP